MRRTVSLVKKDSSLCYVLKTGSGHFPFLHESQHVTSLCLFKTLDFFSSTMYTMAAPLQYALKTLGLGLFLYFNQQLFKAISVPDFT